ncbi:hypothetical protein LTSEALA_0966, partial [Salmonella enterica subsp. enterica serovar Alachua str. R6-377]
SGTYALFKNFFPQRFRNAAALVGDLYYHLVALVAQEKFDGIVAFLCTQTRLKRVIQQIPDDGGELRAIQPLRQLM